MFEPRVDRGWGIPHKHMKYLGGTADFDLWYRNDRDAMPLLPNGDILPYLRVVLVKVDAGDWDDFRLPLHLNEEVGSIGHPAERRLKGRWGDIHLTRDQVNNVETYLRCFAPWALEEE